MNTQLNYLFNVEAPWIYVGTGELERTKWVPAFFYSRPDLSTCVRVLRGKKMRTKQGLMNEIGAAFQLFAEFGENWIALEECLEYLDESIAADAYIVIVENAEEMLIDEPPEQLLAFLMTMNDVGSWWSKPITDNGQFNRNETPFHIQLHVSPNDHRAIERIRLTLEDAKIPFRT